MPQYIVGSHIFFRRELYMECRKNIQRGSAFLRLGIIWGRVSARKKEALQSSQIFFFTKSVIGLTYWENQAETVGIIRK